MPHIFLKCKASGKGDPGGTVRNAKKPLISSGRLDNELAIPFHDVGGLIQLPQHGAGTNHLNGMRLK